MDPYRSKCDCRSFVTSAGYALVPIAAPLAAATPLHSGAIPRSHDLLASLDIPPHADNVILAKQVVAYAENSLAASTKSSYSTACNKFTLFWHLVSAQPRVYDIIQLPLSARTDQAFAAFAVWLYEVCELAASTCSSYVSGLRTTFSLRAGGTPLFDYPGSLTERTLDGITRDAAPPQQATPFTAPLLRDITAWLSSPTCSLSPDPLRRTALACVLIWSFVTGSRIHELLYYSHDPDRLLLLSHLHALPTGGQPQPLSSTSLVNINLPHSFTLLRTKTVQYGQGPTRFVFPCPSSPLCPVVALSSYLLQRQGLPPLHLRSTLDKPDAVFVISGPAGHPTYYSYDHYSSDLRFTLQYLGIPNVAGYTTHSARRGCATALSSANFSLEAISRYVGWSFGTHMTASQYAAADLTTLQTCQQAILASSPVIVPSIAAEPPAARAAPDLRAETEATPTASGVTLRSHRRRLPVTVAPHHVGRILRPDTRSATPRRLE